MPKNIVDETVENNGSQCKIQLMWTSVHSGSNYIVRNYNVKVSTIGTWISREKIQDESGPLDPKTTCWTTKHVRTGHKYNIVLSTSLLNLDSLKEEKFEKVKPVFAGEILR